jgi:hypothetical protein
MLDGGKELDLLAVDPVSGAKYHIEVRVTISKGFKIRLVDSQTKDGRKHRRGLDTLSEEKFSAPVVANAVKVLLGGGEYRKVLVVWDVENECVVEEALSRYGIEVWKMPNLISELIGEVKGKAYRDDVLRTIQLLTLTHQPKAKVNLN